MFGLFLNTIKEIVLESFFKTKSFFKKNLSKFYFFIFGVFLFVIVIIVFNNLFLIPPNDFPEGITFIIPEGATLLQIGDELKSKGIIKSPFWFRFFLTGYKNDSGAVAGEYVFNSSINVRDVAWRISRGIYGFGSVKVTVPEGSSVVDIATILKLKLRNFDDEAFIEIAKEKEGYLFPETYLFSPNETPKTVLSVMTKLFDEKIKTIQKEIDSFGRPLDEIIKMASILEGEASTQESRRIVAGILWKRISLGMPLQVDAVFKYINGKNSFNLSLEDLKINSPYNLYTNKGLPPTPISNPGLDAILATINPVKTNYLYFLSDKKGLMHYAVNFEQHKVNKAKYLTN